VITIDCFGDSYTGGAHGAAFRSVTSFDLNTNRIIKNDEIVTDTLGISAILGKYYLRAKGADSTAHLSDFLFEEYDPLPLPENMALLKDSIIFFYNDYEVAPYSSGFTEIRIPRSEIEQFLNKNLVR
jgi:Protein of unknown function (DUF3298)